MEYTRELPGELAEVGGSVVLHLLQHEVEQHAHLAVLLLLDVEDAQSRGQRDSLLRLASRHWVGVLSASVANDKHDI